tara:strand:- start:106 stop:573 length:468 start_codon:yes stop_codon:yes gene_type:complete
MSNRKKRQKIEGRFVPLQHNLLTSPAFTSLSTTAKVAYVYFLFDIKRGDQTEVILTFEQAKKYSVCSSPTTFMEIKKELVSKGFLDQLESGGLNKPSKFKISYMWKKHGTNLFEDKKYCPGIGAKYFKTAWKDIGKREKLIRARHQTKKPNTKNV